jgi:chemotaxis protein MotB
MLRKLALALVGLPIAACVTTAQLNDQVSKTLAQQRRAEDSEQQLETAQKTIDDQKAQIADARKQADDLKAKIKADEDQIGALQKSNKDLTASLDSSRNDLKMKVSTLIKEKDDLTQKLADLTKTTGDQISDLNKKLDALEQEKEAEIARVKKSYDDITASLKSEIDKGAVQINQLKGKLTLNLVDKVLFKPGEADVNADGQKVLDHIGEVLNNVKDKDIRIEGHTDDRPISGELKSRYPTNWELSAARATAVARYLQDNDGVDPKRLIVTGYGEYRPIIANDTAENRALNRRIEIVLVPHD